MSTASAPDKTSSSGPFLLFNAVISASALGFIGWLLQRTPTAGGANVEFLPALNAGFNTTAALCLVAGYVAVRRRRPDVHRYLMVSAFVASTLFFVGYVIYHYVHGDTVYTGPDRALYLTVLASHVVLSLGVPPLALACLYYAIKRRLDTHRRIARIALPIWLYVSATGVAIFFMLR